MSDQPPLPAAGLLEDAFGRVRGVVHAAVRDLDETDLAFRPDPHANSIAWLVWHLTRVQDDHLAAAFGREQVWASEGWAERFGLPFEPSDTGYGHSSAQVAAVRAGAELLAGYHDASHARTIELLRGLRAEDELQRIVDRRWDPPVTLAVRLVSVVSDNLQHAGQAAFVRGMARRVLHGEDGLEGE